MPVPTEMADVGNGDRPAVVPGADNSANKQRCQEFVLVAGDGNGGSPLEVEGTGNGNSLA